MSSLETYVGIAEIVGAVAIISGTIFALVQLREYRKQRRCQVAAELCRGFTEPALAQAVTLLLSLPDNISQEEMHACGAEYEEAGQLVGMSFETMGLLVHRNIAEFQVVRELTGGLLLMMWRKTGCWIKEVRDQQGNPRFGEWYQWLAERVEECEAEIEPAYKAHAQWTPPRR